MEIPNRYAVYSAFTPICRLLGGALRRVTRFLQFTAVINTKAIIAFCLYKPNML